MKKFIIVFAVFVFTFAVLIFAGTSGYLDIGINKKGKLYINGESFGGGLREAVALAGAGGTIEIEGTVYTFPVGDPSRADEPILRDIIISGKGENAVIALKSGYYKDISNKTDILTVAGENVVIRNLTVDGGFRVDFPIRVLSPAQNVRLENVTAKRGMRGAVNILSDKNISFYDVEANDSVQGGFYLDGGLDGFGITFADCSSRGNFRTGVLIRNCYGYAVNLDLSGIACYEGTFAVEDRIGGGMGRNGVPYSVEIKKPPLDVSGKPIDTSVAAYFNVEKQYHHYRYGIAPAEYGGAAAYIDADRYGMQTRFYYTDAKVADADVKDGEIAVMTGASAFSFAAVKGVFARWLHTVKNFLD
ncbi:MAG: hypothetical protein LBT30_03295 [Clostridiales bacterium]|jgi:hypothetical protein|nr:hypothetical protein [Clostridiales bacterium]